MGKPPHVHVGLNDLRTEDEILLVLAGGDGLNAAIETESLWSEFQSCKRQEQDKKMFRDEEQNRVFQHIYIFCMFAHVWKTT